MDRLVFCAMNAAVLAGTAMAGQVHVYYTPFQSGNGGEFRIVNVSGYAGKVGTYSDITVAHAYNLQGGDGSTVGYAAQQDFQTFCIERNEHVSNNTVYNFQMGAGAMRGGQGGGNPDPVSDATAWMYIKFRNGTLNNFGYNGGGLAAAQIAGEGFSVWSQQPGNADNKQEARRERASRTLQHVMWALEDENVGDNPNNLTAAELAQAQAWINAANAAVAAGFRNNDRVKALNLFNDANGNGVIDWNDANRNGRYDRNETGEEMFQSQLTLVPLPTGVALAGTGMLGLLSRRRRSS